MSPPAWPTINRAAVKAVRRVAWQTDDDPCQGAVIVGRGYVVIGDHAEAHALIVLKHERYWAVVWERETKRFVMLAVDGETRAT